MTDNGYHSRSVLKALDDGPWKTRISEPKKKGFARWHGDEAARPLGEIVQGFEQPVTGSD